MKTTNTEIAQVAKPAVSKAPKLNTINFSLLLGATVRKTSGSIPTGLHHVAQGCEERATLGSKVWVSINPERVAAEDTLYHATANTAKRLKTFETLFN